MLQRVLGVLGFGVVSALAVVGCAAEVDDGSGTSEEALRKADPCAVVRCAAGTHCVAKRGRAACVADTGGCTTDADCRLYDNYCDGCACQALLTTSPDPTCGGNMVACFAQPCMNKVVACVGGACVVQ